MGGDKGAGDGELTISAVEREEKPETETKERREAEQEEQILSIEKIFESKRIPPWQEQLTLRAFAVSLVLAVMFCFIVMKLNLTTGIIPSLNVCAGLLGFFFVKTWTKFLEKSNLLKQPFTRQENTVIQTFVVASSGIAFSGGFGSYLFAMSDRIASQTTEGNNPENVKNPGLGWMIGFLLLVSFLGLFSLVPLRKIMIIDYKLTYPSGTATAHLINSFHTPEGAKLAKYTSKAIPSNHLVGSIFLYELKSGILYKLLGSRKQVKVLGKFFSFSFLCSFFQWFYTAEDICGFAKFPTFGLQAFKNRFYFDFSAIYVGVGMICPHLINVSVFVGGIISWGIMWPLIEQKEGEWYPANIPSSNLQGIQGYRVFIAIAMILGDGLYNFFKVISCTLSSIFNQISKTSIIPVASATVTTNSQSYDDQCRAQPFLKDQIPQWVAIIGYITFAVVSIISLPYIFSPLKWYYILVAYIFAPVLAFCNAYGAGLTDWSLASTYGKLAIFTIGAWAGASNGGVLAGLAACGVMMSIVTTASDLMQDFKTGYLTLASPRSMFFSQVVGTAMGCVISPSVFWLFNKAFHNIGSTDSEYPAPNALIFRNMAILGVQGLSSLPQHCLTLCYVFFSAAILINLVRDLVGKKVARFIPIPMAMAIPFYLGPYFAIDMCVGSLILFIWERINKTKADAFGPAVASGLICGDGIWTLPASVLALAGVNPPICMRFLSRGTNAKVDGFLKNLS